MDWYRKVNPVSFAVFFVTQELAGKFHCKEPRTFHSVMPALGKCVNLMIASVRERTWSFS